MGSRGGCLRPRRCRRASRSPARGRDRQVETGALEREDLGSDDARDPRIPSTLNRFDPSTLPMATSRLLRRAAITEVTSSWPVPAAPGDGSWRWSALGLRSTDTSTISGCRPARRPERRRDSWPRHYPSTDRGLHVGTDRVRITAGCCTQRGGTGTWGSTSRSRGAGDGRVRDDKVLSLPRRPPVLWGRPSYPRSRRRMGSRFTPDPNADSAVRGEIDPELECIARVLPRSVRGDP
jgi:hypothetical protein